MLFSLCLFVPYIIKNFNAYTLFIRTQQFPGDLYPVVFQNTHILSHVFNILRIYLQRRIQSGRGNLKVKIFNLPVQPGFNYPADFCTILNSNTVKAVNKYPDMIPFPYFSIDNKYPALPEVRIYQWIYMPDIYYL